MPKCSSLAAACGMIMALGGAALLTGCNSEPSRPATSAPATNGKPGDESPVAAPPPAAVKFPDGDPSVPAELGGPGFKGEGWQTAPPKPLGDKRAVHGGSITSYVAEWPGNLRMAGTGYNTWLNYMIRDMCYMGLLSMDPNTLEDLPGLASHWKISEDRMKFSFRIDPRAHWSDGMPVVADDVVASWKMQMDKTLLEPSSILTYGKLNEPVAKSKYIVEVTAKTKNWRNFQYFSSMTILPAHEIGKLSGKEYLNKYNYAYTAVNGPYIVHARDIHKGTSIALTRREDWWAKKDKQYEGLYNFDTIRFIVVRDPDLAFQKAVKGEIDFMDIMKAEWWAKDLPKLPAVEKGWLVRQKIFNDAPIGVRGFALNESNPPLNDIRVRKALQYLYDRETLIAKLGYGEYVPLDSYHAGGEYQSPENKPIRYDPPKAVELLAEAGWKEHGPDGVLMKDGRRLQLTLTSWNPAQQKFLTSFQEACKAVGVEIKLDRTNKETMWKNLMERKFEMADVGWGALVFPNPETEFKSDLADENDNNNITGFKSKEVDKLCEEYDLAFTQAERRRIIQRIDHIVYEDHPYVLGWELPCQRILYWNKFGMPADGLDRTVEFEGAYSSWWVDPEKVKALAEARRNDTSLPVPPLEIHFWDKQHAAAAGKAAETPSP